LYQILSRDAADAAKVCGKKAGYKGAYF